jgi:TolB protein
MTILGLGVSLGVFRLFTCLALTAAIAEGGARFAAGQGQMEPLGHQKRGIAPVRIAIVLLGDGAASETARTMTLTIAANLGRDRQLVVVDDARLAETMTDLNKVPAFADWRAINAEALMTGRISSAVGDEVRAEFRLWNIVDGEFMLGRQYFAPADQRDGIAKLISKSIYEHLTGRTDAFN